MYHSSWSSTPFPSPASDSKRRNRLMEVSLDSVLHFPVGVWMRRRSSVPLILSTRRLITWYPSRGLRSVYCNILVSPLKKPLSLRLCSLSLLASLCSSVTFLPLSSPCVTSRLSFASAAIVARILCLSAGSLDLAACNACSVSLILAALSVGVKKRANDGALAIVWSRALCNFFGSSSFLILFILVVLPIVFILFFLNFGDFL